jgi:hypothetical protein
MFVKQFDRFVCFLSSVQHARCVKPCGWICVFVPASFCLFGTAGRPKYKFASFWNRNHTLRTLERALDNFNNMHDAAKQEHEQPFARQEGTFGSLEQNAEDIKTSTPQNLEEIVVLPSIKDDVLHQICKVFSFPAH